MFRDDEDPIRRMAKDLKKMLRALGFHEIESRVIGSDQLQSLAGAERIELDDEEILVWDLHHIENPVLQHKMIEDTQGQKTIIVADKHGRFKDIVMVDKNLDDEYEFHFTNGILEIVLKKK